MKLEEIPTQQVFRKKMKETPNPRLLVIYLRTPLLAHAPNKKQTTHAIYQPFRQIYVSYDLGVQEMQCNI